MKVGITGSRRGLNSYQIRQLGAFLSEPRIDELHHGDCVGVDAKAHEMAVRRAVRTVIHPPINPGMRAFCKGDEEREPKEYLDRNHDIVDETDMLIAIPETSTEIIRGSGTWATIRYAKQRGKSVIIIAGDINGTQTED